MLRHGWSPINIDKFYDTLLRLPVPRGNPSGFPESWHYDGNWPISRDSTLDIIIGRDLYFRAILLPFHPLRISWISWAGIYLPLIAGSWSIEVNDADPIRKQANVRPPWIVYRGTRGDAISNCSIIVKLGIYLLAWTVNEPDENIRPIFWGNLVCCWDKKLYRYW